MRPAPKTSGPIGVFNAITASKITATRDRFTHVADHPGHRHLTVPAVTHHLRGLPICAMAEVRALAMPRPGWAG